MTPEPAKDNRPMLYLDSTELTTKVSAGASADRTMALLHKTLTPDQFDNFLFWLHEAEKEGRQLQTAADVNRVRANRIADARRKEAVEAQLKNLGIEPSSTQPTKSVPPKPKPQPSLSVKDLSNQFGF